MLKVTKAVFPVAGLGTRFLPATKASPKEMLPIVDKPLIQYAVEEAMAAGITEMIFVTGRSKRAIEDHFDKSYEIEAELEARGKLLLARPEDALEASPLTFVAGNRVPFYMVWGDNDLEYVLRTCPTMVDALRQAGSQVVHEVFAGYDHFQPSLDGGRRDSEWVKTVRAWMLP